MKVLLDTHVFLWYIVADTRLPESFRASIQDPENELFLSVASVWEAVIKFQIGKLMLPSPPAEYLPQRREAHGISSLGISEEVMSHLASLPPHHRDPFDRILVAQALQYGLTIATVDPLVAAYTVPLLSVT